MGFRFLGFEALGSGGPKRRSWLELERNLYGGSPKLGILFLGVVSYNKDQRILGSILACPYFGNGSVWGCVGKCLETQPHEPQSLLGMIKRV